VASHVGKPDRCGCGCSFQILSAHILVRTGVVTAFAALGIEWTCRPTIGQNTVEAFAVMSQIVSHAKTLMFARFHTETPLTRS
jgi:hypothetical protein